MAIATPHQHKAAFYPTTNIKMVKQTHDRTSFSSIKESDDGIAQSFTTSKTSSYLRAEDEEVISDGLITPPTMTNPQSALHGVVCPCNGFRGWKAISLRGKVASKSSGDLKALRNNFDWDVKRDVRAPVAARREDGRCEAGKSPLETLPMELLGTSISISCSSEHILGRLFQGDSNISCQLVTWSFDPQSLPMPSLYMIFTDLLQALSLTNLLLISLQMASRREILTLCLCCSRHMACMQRLWQHCINTSLSRTLGSSPSSSVMFLRTQL